MRLRRKDISNLCLKYKTKCIRQRNTRRLLQTRGEAGKRERKKGEQLLRPASKLDSKIRERSQQDKCSKQVEFQRDTV